MQNRFCITKVDAVHRPHIEISSSTTSLQIAITKLILRCAFMMRSPGCWMRTLMYAKRGANQTIEEANEACFLRGRIGFLALKLVSSRLSTIEAIELVNIDSR
jgi:hypothetical protein